MKKHLFAWILLGLVLGIFFGIFLGNVDIVEGYSLVGLISPLGVLFIRLLQMIVSPIIFFSLIVATAGMSPSRLGQIGIKTAALYLITGFFAAVIGLFFANLFPFEGTIISVTIEGASAPALKESSLLDMLLEIVPTNPFYALTAGNMLQIIFFAIFFGIGLAVLRDSEKKELKNSAELIFSFCTGFSEVMYILVHWIMYFAPFGVFSLMSDVFAKNGIEAVSPLLEFVGVVYLAFFIHFFVVYGSLLRYAGWRIVPFVQGAKDPITTALVTRSSTATLPITMDAAETKLGIPRSIGSFTLPLGATLNMDGVTIQQCISVFFIAGVAGLSLDFSQQVIILLVTVIASIGTAGIPSGAAIMLLVVLESIGLTPTDGSVVAAAYAMLLGIDAIMDMGQTSLNVTGDLVCASVVTKMEEKEETEHQPQL